MSEPTKQILSLPDGSKVTIVSGEPSVGEINEETVIAVKDILKSFPGAKVTGSIPRVI